MKKAKKYMKENYRPVSILPALLKVIEKSLFISMSDYFEDIFDEQQRGFRKDYNNQQCLLKTLEKWRNSADKGRVFCALLPGLFKVFDCLDHEHLIAQLNEFGDNLN